MGSLFSPVVPAYSPMVYAPSTPRVNSSSPDNAGAPQTGGEETFEREDSVRDFIRRTNRGRNSLIQTSYRGVLSDLNSLAPQRKNLLGE